MKTHAIRFGCFGVIGLINTLADFSVYSLLVLAADFHVVSANILAFALAVLLSYFLNSRYTFRSAGAGAGHSLRLIKFIAVNGVGLVLSTALVLLLAAPIGPLSAKLCALGVVAIWSYLGSHFFVFHASHISSQKS